MSTTNVTVPTPEPACRSSRNTVTADAGSPDDLRFLLPPPLRYLRQVPWPIRLLSVCMLINSAGVYVTLFLTLILCERHVSTPRIGLALAMAGAFAIAGSWFGGFLVPRLRWRLALV